MSTVADRRALGRAARAIRPRSGLADFTPAARRQDPVQVLLAQERDREMALTPLRHRRMSASPFAFYRGSAAIMAADLGAVPSTGLTTWLCGDAHVANFGLFAAPDRSIVFDVNDFDETSTGPFEWDVMRLAASLVLACQENGASDSKARQIVAASLRGYREQMAIHAKQDNLDNWYARIDVGALSAWSEGEGKSARSTMRQAVAKAETRDAWSALDKMTVERGGRRQLIDQPPLILPLSLEGGVAHAVTEILASYQRTLPPDRVRLLERYHLIDIGHKVVGVGSVGLLAVVVLLQGRDGDDLLVLQAKQAVSSALEPYSGASVYSEHGQRVVVGQQLMQAASDPLLGWVTTPAGRSFYLRQLRDKKYSPDITRMKPKVLGDYALLCGRALARAHARAGDPIAIAGYLGGGSKFDEAMVGFAFSYARQVHADFAEFTRAIADGRIRIGSAEQDRALSLEIDESGKIVVTTGTV